MIDLIVFTKYKRINVHHIEVTRKEDLIAIQHKKSINKYFDIIIENENTSDPNEWDPLLVSFFLVPTLKFDEIKNEVDEEYKKLLKLSSKSLETYWHISNSGVTFSIIDDFGPTLVIESSAFGNMTTTQKFHTDKKSLLYLRSVIDHALTKDFSKDYCEKAHVQDYEKKPKTEIFLGGDCAEMWRPAIIEKFPEIDFIDPYDKNWVAEENIYTELGDAFG